MNAPDPATRESIPTQGQKNPDAGVSGNGTKAGGPDAAAARPFPALVLAATAFTKGQLIEPDAAQVALAGRSNVGKSSLINALAGRKALAKVSASPGKTRSINYYRLGDSPSFLVDLPGYGYARCGRGERDAWAALMTHYFCHTPGLRALVLLLDARLPPQTADRELLAYAASLGLPVTPVLTKADKCSRREIQACVRAWSVWLGPEPPLVTSAGNKTGLQEMKERILRLLRD